MSFRGPEGNSRREPITTAARMRTAYFIEDPAGTFSPTTDRRAATHVLDVSGDTYTMTAIGASVAPATVIRRGDSDLIIRGAA